MSDEPRTLLLGCGYTLGRLANTLGAGAVVVTRSSVEGCTALERRGFIARVVDLSHPETLLSVLREFPSITTVIDSVPPTEAIVASFRGIVSALAASAVERLLYLSTTGVFGGDDGGWVTEETPSNPAHPGAKLRETVEELYRLARCEVSRLRLPAIYGPGRGIGHALRAGRYALVDSGNRWTNRIHVDDIVQLLQAMLTTSPLPEVLCVCDDEPALARDVVEFYCRTFAIPRPPEISLESALAQGRWHQLSNQRVSNERMRSILKGPLRYPTFRDGAHTEFEGGGE